MTEPTIRRAEVPDAEAGAWCHLICWREAYAGLIEPDRLAEKTSDLERRIERWTSALAAGVVRWIAVNPDRTASVSDQVVGFSASGPSRDDEAPTPLELYSIYARRDWWGSGLGHRLLDSAIGRDAATVWVLEDNRRARAFYRRHGFVPDGFRVDEPFLALPEIRMVRPAR